jgi:hypothetical protein
MAKKLQLSIPIPCHENWNAMNPVEKGRFCDSCQKQVVDFSNMSDRQVAEFFKKPTTGSVCGRFMTDQLDRDIDIPKKRIPWIKYFFQFALPAFLVSAKATAQGGVIRTIKTEQKPDCTKTMGAPVKYYPVNKVIPNPVKKETVPSIIVTNPAREIMGDVYYPVLKDTLKPIDIVAGEISINPVAKSVLDDTIMLKEVVVVATIVQGRLYTEMGILATKIEEKSQVKEPDSLFKKIIKKIFPGSFRVYPNPAKGGAVLNIEWKQEESGNFLLHLLTMSGQLVFTKEMYIDADARLLDLQLPSVIPGTYILQISNKQSGNNFTEKIVIL